MSAEFEHSKRTVSNHIIKPLAIIAAMQAMRMLEALLFLDADAFFHPSALNCPQEASSWPWAGELLPEVLSSRPDIDVVFTHITAWLAGGRLVLVRPSDFSRTFFRMWFHLRCGFKDQYSLWLTTLRLARGYGCFSETFEFEPLFHNTTYWELKRILKDALGLKRTRARRCPLFPFDTTLPGGIISSNLTEKPGIGFGFTLKGAELKRALARWLRVRCFWLAHAGVKEKGTTQLILHNSTGGRVQINTIAFPPVESAADLFTWLGLDPRDIFALLRTRECATSERREQNHTAHPQCVLLAPR